MTTQAVTKEEIPERVRRWSLWQRAKNQLIWWAIRILLRASRAIPLSWMARLLRGAAFFAPWLLSKPTAMADANLERAFPKKDRDERQRIRNRMYAHLATCLAEVLQAPRLLGAGQVVMHATDRAVLQRAHGAARGVLVFTGHLGNWELLAQFIAREGFDVTAIGKRSYDPRITSLLQSERRRYGMEILWRGDANIGRGMLRALASNRFLAVLVDQATRVPNHAIPFFGKPAATPKTPSELAIKSGCVPIFVWSYRAPDGVHHVRVRDLSTETFLNAEELSNVVNRALEDAIEVHPEQWVWMHDRWSAKRLESCS